VNRFVKLAAAMLALMLFGTPLVALVNCSPKAAMAGHCGGEHCPMMHARQHSDTQISEAPSGDSSCCQMSSLPPSAANPAVTNEARVSLQPPTSQTLSVATAMPILAAAQGPPAESLLAVGPPQAVLCTFLV
jgi:hypothetical protein